METEPTTTETKEEVNYLICEKCNCKNIGVIKKGFSGRYAVYGYLIAGGLGGLLVRWALSDENNYKYIYLCYCICVVLCLLSFFAGTIGMNDIYSICLRCGHKILIDKANKSETLEETSNDPLGG